MRHLIRHAAWVLAGLLTLEIPAPAIDFTPRFTETVIDGVAFRRLYFADGEKKIGLSLNQETRVEPGGGGAVFRFTKVPDATFLIRPSTMTPDQPFEGPALDRYREAARQFLPAGVTNVKALAEEADTLPINRWTSRRFSFTCEAPDGTWMMSVTFLNVNKDEQLVLVTTATERNFPEAAERSFQIIRTWQPLRPKDERPIKSS